MTHDFLVHLAVEARNPRVRVDAALEEALAQLAAVLERLCQELQVEYVGPPVGVEAREVHRLVVAAHAWTTGAPSWGVRVCSSRSPFGWRAEWTLAGAGRLRKRLIVQALPEFLEGFVQAVVAAGKADTPAGRQLARLREAFSGSGSAVL
jgi:predicted transcriptional regulator